MIHWPLKTPSSPACPLHTMFLLNFQTQVPSSVHKIWPCMCRLNLQPSFGRSVQCPFMWKTAWPLPSNWTTSVQAQLSVTAPGPLANTDPADTSPRLSTTTAAKTIRKTFFFTFCSFHLFFVPYRPSTSGIATSLLIILVTFASHHLLSKTKNRPFLVGFTIDSPPPKWPITSDGSTPPHCICLTTLSSPSLPPSLVTKKLISSIRNKTYDNIAYEYDTSAKWMSSPLRLNIPT